MQSFKPFYFLFGGFLLSMLLSACGSKGDLYQVVEPEPEQSVVIKAPQQTNQDIQKKSK